MNAKTRPDSPNKILGTWRMVTAQIDPEERNQPAYGTRPAGLLSFTPDMHFVEVLTDADIPRFASDARGEGTDAENRAAMAGSIGFFGTYSVVATANSTETGSRVPRSRTGPVAFGHARSCPSSSMAII